MDKQTKKEFESLARMVKKGFDGVDRRFKNVDSRFDNVDSRFDNIESRLSSVELQVREGKIDNEKRFDAIEKKIDQSWSIMDGYVKAQEDFREEFKIMKYKMTQMEKIIKTKLGVALE